MEMKEFIETAKLLGCDQQTIEKAVQTLTRAGLGPGDPESLRVLMNVFLEFQSKQSVDAIKEASANASKEIQQATIQSVGHLKKSGESQLSLIQKATAEKMKEARAVVSATGCEIAKDISKDIGDSVNEAILKTVRTKYHVSVFGFFVVTLILSVVGFYCGMIFQKQHDSDLSGFIPDSLNSWLSGFSPLTLVCFGTVAFVLLRVACAYCVNSKAIRWLFVLPDSKPSWR